MRLLNKAKQPSNTDSIVYHPREYLTQIVNLTVFKLYGLDDDYEVTRQNKSVATNSGNFIDYVFACFDLANRVGDSPHRVAENLSKNIHSWLSNNHPQMLDRVSIEAINGYVNFQLTDEYIAEAAYHVAHWLQKPQMRIHKNKTAYFIVLGPTIGSDIESTIQSEAFELLSELYFETGFQIKTHYILSDASENAATSFSRLLKEGHKKDPNMVEEAKFDIKIRKMLSKVESPDRRTDKIISGFQKDFLNKSEHELEGSPIHHDEIEPESELVQKVNKWLDQISKARDHIIADEHSRAVYYQVQDGPLSSLRSSSGILFSPTFLLYEFDQFLQEYKKKPKKREPIVAIIPQKYYQLLYSYADKLVQGISYNNFVCVDPMLLHSSAGAHLARLLPQTFEKMAHTLGVSVINKVHVTQDRQKVLTLVDFPVELNQLVSGVKPVEVANLLATDQKIAEELI